MAKGDEGFQVDDKKLVFDSLFAYREEDEQINNGYWMIFVEKES